MKIFSAFVAGLIFGLGLLISGMSNPQKVLNFLDLAGTWDPSLAFVMSGAILVAAPGFYWVRRKSTPLFANQFKLPAAQTIDTPLIGGSVLFGIGWGIGGFCPGPALVSVVPGSTSVYIFVGAMLAGMWLTFRLRR